MGEFVKYYQPDEIGAFSGIQSFQNNVKNSAKWLKSQDTYTLHKPVRKRFLRRKTIVPGPNFQMQADLIDFSNLKQYNDHFRYILIVIDAFSKRAFAAYLKKKTGAEMVEAFQSIFLKTGSFQKLQTDFGKEFFNKTFQTWLQQKNIELFHTQNYDIKASIVERFIQTLKKKLARYFTYTNTRRYVDVLPSLIKSYNNTYHSSIKRSPNSVDSSNLETVWQTLYSQPNQKKPKLQVGDRIRLSMSRARFRKSYWQGWTDELFFVAKVIKDNPPHYKIKDYNGEWLDGTFYEEELQKIYKNDDIFQIEHIVKKRRKRKQVEYLIKWLGYPISFNSWIPEKDLIRYG